MKTYQKLFPIEYNNKTFMIFLDENNRRTFLEINKDGKYEYPTLEEFLQLNKTFNCKDPHIYYSVTKFTFKEKVKHSLLGLLSVIAVINSMPNASATEIKTKIEDGNLIISEEETKSEKQTISFETISELESQLGQLNITKDLVLEAINKNDNLNTKYKKIATELLESILEKYPDFNLRIFYENISCMKVKEYTLEEFRKKFPNALGAGAQYNEETNTITTIDVVPVELLTHEMYHSTYYFYRAYGDLVISRNENYLALSEAMTDEGASLARPITDGYKFNRAVLNYLRNFVAFDLNDYNEYGIDNLFQKLQTKYPDIDFNYINETLNTINDTKIYQGKIISIDLCPEFIDELFEICLKEVSLKTGYEPFNEFAKLFFDAKNPELVFEYLDRYNSKLKSIGYPDIISKEEALANFRKIKIYNAIGVYQGSLYPVQLKGEERIIDIDGQKKEVALTCARSSFSFESLISSFMFQDYKNINSIEFWKNLNAKHNLISPHFFKAIPIYHNQKLLASINAYDYSIEVGIDKNYCIGFRIIDKEGNGIYETSDFLTNSTTVNLDFYLNFYSDYIASINLEDVLNIDYIKKVQKAAGIFKNLKFIGNDFLVLPNIDIEIKTEQGNQIVDLYKCLVFSNDNMINISGTDISFTSDIQLPNSIDLEDILDYFNVLDQNESKYTFTELELQLLIENYIKEMNIAKSR